MVVVFLLIKFVMENADGILFHKTIENLFFGQRCLANQSTETEESFLLNLELLLEATIEHLNDEVAIRHLLSFVEDD